MDASIEDQDIVLQRSSPELIQELRSSLDTFLWRRSKSGKKQLHKYVRVREVDRLVDILEPFQELPQLLDPHLESLVPVLANAFLEPLTRPRVVHARVSSQLLTPLSQAICRLLYTICKIRGEKVIVRFFSTEVRYIELLLSAVEGSQSGDLTSGTPWSWEERYITLLWLSQLLLAPFDLSTISSEKDGTGNSLDIPGLNWPTSSSTITSRVVRVAIDFLSSSGKERDAAKVLLVRVSLRRDVQEAGFSAAIITWAVSMMSKGPNEGRSAYFHLGVLSYVAGLLSSSVGTTYVCPYLSIIYDKVQNISPDNEELTTLFDLALVRKTVVKILRTVSIISVQNPDSFVTAEIVEGSISTLLGSLSDSSTPVRLAASKALSMITLKLDSEMATQVIDAVLESLQVNVTWSTRSEAKNKARDLSRVNPYEWHGLILTLSHLLYRHSPPLSSLSDILSALRLGLSFEQKSTTGASRGTNVRDAACFGIWALARRYSTEELQNVQLAKDFVLGITSTDSQPSVLQSLANLLVVSACLDPAGNIRRGSSAALQELIGRHPNTIAEGISVVQVVDYHAVALRSRAIQEVALNCCRLSRYYYEALLENLLGWRGIRDPIPSTRKYAAATFGALTRAGHSITITNSPSDGLAVSRAVEATCHGLLSLPIRDTDSRHGLLMCLVHLLMPADDGIGADIQKCNDVNQTPSNAGITLQVSAVLKQIDEDFSKYRAPELIAAAASQMISALLLHLNQQSQPVVQEARNSLAEVAQSALNTFMHLNSDECVQQVSDAATDLLLWLSSEAQTSWCNEWITQAEHCRPSTNHAGRAYIHSLFFALSVAKPEQEVFDRFHDMIMQRWTSSGQAIVTKTTILSCLSHRRTATSFIVEFLDLVVQGMDDHTTDTRGDVGSFVRIDALRVVAVLWSTEHGLLKLEASSMNSLLERVLRLTAEKLDKVRHEAQLSLSTLLNDSDQSTLFKNMSTSSTEYFQFLLQFSVPNSINALVKPDFATQSLEIRNLLSALLTGFVSSADTGSEDIVLASREALAAFCVGDNASAGNSQGVFNALSTIVKINEGEDKIVVPAMEVLGFLNDIGGWQGVKATDLRLLFLRNQKAHFKTTNVKKLDAAIKLYGSLIEAVSLPFREQISQEDNDLRIKVVDKLTSMLSHPFPRVRERIAEELWTRCGVGKSIDVSVKSVGKDVVGKIRRKVLLHLEQP